jgi:hypothetical protein
MGVPLAIISLASRHQTYLISVELGQLLFACGPSSESQLTPRSLDTKVLFQKDSNGSPAVGFDQVVLRIREHHAALTSQSFASLRVSNSFWACFSASVALTQ